MMQAQDDFPQQSSGEVQAGEYLVKTGTGPASEIVRVQRPEQDLERHPAPLYGARQTTIGFLDREQELRTVGRALALGQKVYLYGPGGAGKTELINRILNMQLPGAFPDGMPYLSAGKETYTDLLTQMLSWFYRVPPGLQVNDNSVRRYMDRVCALIIVDDADELDANEIGSLVRALPQCAVLVAGEHQQRLLGQSVALGGLPLEQGVALFAQVYPQASVEDRPVIEQICAALDNLPLSIWTVAVAVAQQWVTLVRAVDQASSEARMSGSLPAALSVLFDWAPPPVQRLLRGLVAAGGTTVDVEALSAITGMPPEEATQTLAHLERLGLIKSHSPRYSVADGFRPLVEQGWADCEMQARAAEHFLHRAGRLRTHSRDPDEENVGAALDYYYRHEQWPEVIQITEAADGYLATTGRWGQWERWLGRAWKSARMLGDPVKEAWAQNQLGVLAAGRGNSQEALAFFRGALSGWQAGGFGSGVELTQRNMQALAGSPGIEVPVSPPIPIVPVPVRARGKDIPIVGRIAAGEPILAEENIEGLILVEDEIAERVGFGLRVVGSSMVGAAILEGDIILMEQRSDPPPNGWIVAAIVIQMDVEATLKRFYDQGDHIALEPANDSEPFIIVKPDSVPEWQIRNQYERTCPQRPLNIYSGAKPEIAGWAVALIREEVR